MVEGKCLVKLVDPKKHSYRFDTIPEGDKPMPVTSLYLMRAFLKSVGYTDKNLPEVWEVTLTPKV